MQALGVTWFVLPLGAFVSVGLRVTGGSRAARAERFQRGMDTRKDVCGPGTPEVACWLVGVALSCRRPGEARAACPPRAQIPEPRGASDHASLWRPLVPVSSGASNLRRAWELTSVLSRGTVRPAPMCLPLLSR